MLSSTTPPEAEKEGKQYHLTDAYTAAIQNNTRQISKASQNVPTLSSFIRIFTFMRLSDCAFEAVAVLAAIGAGIAGVLVVIVFGQFMTLLSDFTSGRSQSTPDKFMADIIEQAMYLVYVGIGKLGLTYIHSALFTYVSFRVTREIRHRYLRAALSQEVAYFDHGTSGSVAMQATSKGKLIQTGIAERLGATIQSAAGFVAASVVSLVAQWKLSLIVSCTVPVLAVVIGCCTAGDTHYEVKILQAHGEAGTYAENALGGVKTIHAYNLRTRIVEKYGRYLEEAFRTAKKKGLIQGVLYGINYLIFYSILALSFWQGVAFFVKGEVSAVGQIFTVMFATIVVITAISQAAPNLAAISRAGIAAAELFALIDRGSEINPFNKDGDAPDNIHGAVDIEEVTFSYPSRPRARVLQDFSLRIPAGKTTALVGTSGSGKSTIIGLLERWYNPNSGVIKLDGRDIKDLNLKWLRTHIRLVQQEPVLFNDTVFRNIANGLAGTPWESEREGHQMARVVAAAKLAFAHDFITALPQGYHTNIGQQGGLLSGGQKQRIAIARSVISDPKVLLLDEATSALDPQAEGIVQGALNNVANSRTTIVIAHKLATIRNADNIVVMSQGRIVEQGTHNELVLQDGVYAKLVRAQNLQDGNPVDNEKDQSTSDDDPILEPKSPQHSLEKVVTAELEREVTAEARQVEALQAREDYSQYRGAGMIRTVANLVRMTEELRMFYAGIVLACLVGSAVYPIQAFILANMVDAFTLPESSMVARGNFLSLMFFVMGVGSLLTFFGLGSMTSYVAQSLAQKTRKKMFSSFLRQDLRFFNRQENTIGAIVGRLDTYPEAICELMGMNVSVIFVCVFNVLGCSIMALVASWKLGLVTVFAGLPPVLGAGYARIRLEQGLERQTDARFLTSTSIASESVTAIRTVSSLTIEDKILDKYASELDKAVEEMRGPLFHMMAWFGLTQSAEIFVTALGFWWGGRLISDGDITFYQFILSFLGMYFSGQSAAWLFGFSNSFTKANMAANYFMWLNSLQPTIREVYGEESNRVSHSNCQSIEFDRVRFSYPSAPKNTILRGVSLTVQPGQFVAFVGASGCGKSTMISLLERFYDPTSGTIKVGGAAITDLNPRLYRSRISLVQQEPILFTGSIRENIVQGVEVEGEVSDNDIEDACRAANAWDFICSLPEGLNTHCGPSGGQLSGGQRQRISIARALIRKPAVLLLDEATSALDTESERVIQRTLVESAAAHNRATVAVAHRLSTVRDADRIFVFSGGRIAEAGTHEQLVEMGGLYKDLYEAQRLD